MAWWEPVRAVPQYWDGEEDPSLHPLYFSFSLLHWTNNSGVLKAKETWCVTQQCVCVKTPKHISKALQSCPADSAFSHRRWFGSVSTSAAGSKAEQFCLYVLYRTARRNDAQYSHAEQVLSKGLCVWKVTVSGWCSYLLWVLYRHSMAESASHPASGVLSTF